MAPDHQCETSRCWQECNSQQPTYADMAVKRIEALVPVSCCQLTDAGQDVCDHPVAMDSNVNRRDYFRRWWWAGKLFEWRRRLARVIDPAPEEWAD